MNEKNIRTKASFKKPIAHPLKLGLTQLRKFQLQLITSSYYLTLTVDNDNGGFWFVLGWYNSLLFLRVH